MTIDIVLALSLSGILVQLVVLRRLAKRIAWLEAHRQWIATHEELTRVVAAGLPLDDPRRIAASSAYSQALGVMENVSLSRQ